MSMVQRNCVSAEAYERSTKLSNRDNYLKRQWGLTQEDYDDMLLAQGGRCAICLNKPRTRALHIDHDHSCCKRRVICGGTCIRGLICMRCNHGLLGHAHDSVEMLRRAVAYLENPPAKGLFSADRRDHLASEKDNSTE